MRFPILVAYSTCAGSTGEVADFIAEELRSAGLNVELSRMCDLSTFNRYSAAILGAPIYMGKLTAEARNFLNRYQSQITQLPTWFYVLGPIRGVPWEYREAVDHTLNQFKKFPWLEVEKLKVFGGRLDTNNMPFPYSIAAQLPASPLKDYPVTDVRDWSDIRAWAKEIVNEFLIRYDVEGLTMRLNGALIH